MPRKPDITAETKLLRDTITQAHQAIKDLRQAIKAANALTPTLTAQFEQHHNHELEQLSNRMQVISNHAATQLNAEVTHARREIMRQLSISKLTYNADDDTLSITWQGTQFDDQIPAPYESNTAQETNP